MKKYFILAIATFFLILLSIIPLRLAIASYLAPQPQAILTLGGTPHRENFTAKLAKYHPSLDIWVSSGVPPKQAKKIFRAAGINLERVHLDYRAVDTVTNFTFSVQEFKKRQIHHIYLITSDFHMRRAKAIATFVLGSQGIAFTPVSVPLHQPRETTLHVVRDIIRSLVWLYTGRTGATLNPDFQNR